MSDSELEIWHPRPEQVARANVTQLITLLGVKDYEAMYRYSIERPADYWRAILKFCGIVWSKDYDQYADFSAGKEFPKWFVGGKLNWTETIFRWAKDPATASRNAVVAETEDGRITAVTYAELHDRVRAFAAGLKKLGLRRGDRVGLLMEPGIEAVVSIIGVSYMGAIVMPLFSGFGVDPIISRLEACDSSLPLGPCEAIHRNGYLPAGDANLLPRGQVRT